MAFYLYVDFGSGGVGVDYGSGGVEVDCGFFVDFWTLTCCSWTFCLVDHVSCGSLQSQIWNGLLF